ncbi:MAG: signal peptidase I [Treponemataceae bacterium]
MRKSKTKHSFLFFIFSGFLIGIFFKLFFVDFVKISGNSMYPTLKDGKYVFVFKSAYGLVKPFSSDFLLQWNTPKENDIVIFLQGTKMNVKRCAAKENTPIECIKNSSYHMKVDSRIIPLTKEQFEKMKYHTYVPQGKILLIGDNYLNSIDSRDFGFISTKNVIGKVICK